MAGIIIKNLLLQLLFIVGFISAIGLFVWFLSFIFFRLTGKNNRKIGLATGFLGTPVHEIGHAFFCVLFGHRIVSMALFRPNAKDGILGYVNHTYNRKNIFHQVGNFFIGLGPIILGTGALLLLLLIFTPTLLKDMIHTMNIVALKNLTVTSFSSIFESLWKTIKLFFSAKNLINPMWWLFMIPASSIALHMSLSFADVKGSALGFGFIVLALLITNIILALIKSSIVWGLTNVCLRISVFVLNFLFISVLLSLMLVIAAAIVRSIHVLVIKIKNRRKQTTQK